jgi:uncharacterized protein
MPLLQIKVKPNSRTSGLVQLAQLKSPPVDGKANAELIALIAMQLGCPRKAISMQVGPCGRIKLAYVAGF